MVSRPSAMPASVLRAGLLCAVGIGLLTLTGCGGPSARVKGRVTCQGKALTGSIMFSPKGEGANNIGPPAMAQLSDDGTYELVLKTIGPHTVVITPADIRYPVPEGEFDHPCDRSPFEREVIAGENTISIELKTRTR